VTPAHAHAILVASQPADRGTLAAGSDEVRLQFNSRIDKYHSRLTLEGTNARMVLPLEPGQPPDILAAKVELTPGPYVVHWQALATDGHMTHGDVRLTVPTK